MNFFSWNRFFTNFPKILVTLPVDLEIVIVTYSLGLVLAVVLACIRIKKIPVLNQLTVLFVSFERDTPLFVQMLVSYYGIPLLIGSIFDIDTRDWSRIVFVFIAYTANVGAFLSEVFRASILAIPKGQTDAALSCGLTNMQCFFRIIFPQSVRIALPNMWTFLISLFKSTSLVYMIGVVDTIGRAQAIGSATSHSLESYIIVALIFVVFSLFLQLPYSFVEKKLSFTKENKFCQKKEARNEL